ncbi:molybdate ABC transporter substrate-binding protein [Breoghania sp. L-A4]|uniref:molybdate ABC transporter substrate-binding protein n=1 Tax=Breoghania sp. L-A4 TaxID=2304600 RepID=UPI000E35F057|nr:molybdate ABC transporter substrate-binding protein [Breoghania sp. L-A4]AXS41957.1 molybdate ABC transporter substrate-binding protein [Breoghania sp. L-A4]
MKFCVRPLIRALLVGAAAAACTLAASMSAHAAETPVVFAAASLKNAMEDIGARYQAKTGTSFVFSFAASSALARQIEAGAPADVYVSANVDWMDYLEQRGLIDASCRVIVAGNTLVVVAPRDRAEPLDLASAEAVMARLGDGRLSLGDPDHVPAGRYAQSALQATGLWPRVADHLARGDNVRVALALVARGEAPLGVVYGSDAAIEPDVAVVAQFADTTHAPIAYPAAPVAASQHKDFALDFVAFLLSPGAREAFADAGLKPVD